MSTAPAHISSLLKRDATSVCIWFVLLLFCHRVQAQTPSRGYQVKAVFLYNFTQFVEWPPAAFASDNAPFVIAVLGPNPFGTFLDETVAGEKLQGHPLEVRHYTDSKEIKDCHILFINQPVKAAEVFLSENSKSILTVTDEDRVATGGGIIRFFTDTNKIRLKINPSAAKAANLSISSKLLRLAVITEN